MSVDEVGLKVHQLDSVTLDQQLQDSLSEILGESLKWVADESSPYRRTLKLALQLVCWKLSIWDRDATYGGMLQGLKYVQSDGSSLSSWKKIMLGVEFLRRNSDTPEFLDTLPSSILHWSRLLSQGLSIWTALHFLRTGSYHTPLAFVLRLRLVSVARQFSRDISFEFLNRQLIWHAFTEFLLFILPLLSFPRLRKRLQRFVLGNKSSGNLSFLPRHICAVCHETNAEQIDGSKEITNASRGECGCVYCYDCLGRRIEDMAGEGWDCLRCGKKIHHVLPI